MVPPADMCRKHLLGEHVEIHMTVGTLNRGKSLAGFLANDLLEPQSLHSRHDALVREMTRRGYRHASPLPALHAEPPVHRIDAAASAAELIRRCSLCRTRRKGASPKLQTLQTNHDHA